ncbi:MAG: PTS sugar transporter subunit IIB [Propionicimonas sp.]|uniref:PTS sugar transporter subunit IIB n=1 Tax=Propionicimonas sp. TaxID=1955623 RepID=UPI002B20BF36|nr:PTS sugar transporter subunit IIB [Propionicimonas sp.]MEA4943238.1 PTS sugar transporter subunit IIB [Propionicimonas sp.]MEA5054701.1 PTS sugar transporter subunit IIB [Propionicimonas sp.]MEA5117915.1 PTS sugar transporter subunit IIB [Propionicimonas sp.]
MKIVTVCGMGIGTSVLLKMNTEKALRTLGVDADVEAADIGTARGAARTADVVFTSADLVEEIGQVPAKVVVIKNFTSVDEVTQKLTELLGLGQ